MLSRSGCLDHEVDREHVHCLQQVNINLLDQGQQEFAQGLIWENHATSKGALFLAICLLCKWCQSSKQSKSRLRLRLLAIYTYYHKYNICT